MMRTIYILFLMLLSSNLNAQILKQFTFQGKLSDVNENFTGTKTIEYTVYDLNDILWRENHENVAVKNGNYEVKLGSITSFPSTLFKADVIERTVVIKVEGITQGFFRLPDFTQNNCVFNGKTLTVDFGKYGKEIDFDKIKLEEYYQKYAELFITLENQNTLEQSDTSGLYYQYYKVLASFAKTDINQDGEELFIMKIGSYLNKDSDVLIGDLVHSKRAKMSLVETSILVRDWEFAENYVTLFKGPLNVITNEETLLDWIYEHFVFFKNNIPDSEKINYLIKYYKLFKSKGARHHKYPATTTID